MKRFILFLVPLFAMLHSARSAVIYSGLQNIPIATTFDGTTLDVDTGTTSTVLGSGWDVNFFFGGYGIANSAAFQPVRADATNMSAVLNLASGVFVDSLLDYAAGEAGSSTHIGGGANQFTAGSQGYLGFKFTTNSNAGPYYGWMRVTLTVNTSGATIHDWAYDDTGAGIFVGSIIAVPEPSRAMLVVLSMTAMALRRRRC